ncbi:MAG TPA: hypothetical protein VHU17_15010, partial [Acidimicrobiales bacterium]|nr:hypothetical protein [Acidimicrobiales bacterium]
GYVVWKDDDGTWHFDPPPPFGQEPDLGGEPGCGLSDPDFYRNESTTTTTTTSGTDPPDEKSKRSGRSSRVNGGRAIRRQVDRAEAPDPGARADRGSLPILGGIPILVSRHLSSSKRSQLEE